MTTLKRMIRKVSDHGVALVVIAVVLVLAVLIILNETGEDYGCQEDVDRIEAQASEAQIDPNFDTLVDDCIEIRRECEEAGQTNCNDGL